MFTNESFANKLDSQTEPHISGNNNDRMTFDPPLHSCSLTAAPLPCPLLNEYECPCHLLVNCCVWAMRFARKSLSTAPPVFPYSRWSASSSVLPPLLLVLFPYRWPRFRSWFHSTECCRRIGWPPVSGTRRPIVPEWLFDMATRLFAPHGRRSRSLHPGPG